MINKSLAEGLTGSQCDYHGFRSEASRSTAVSPGWQGWQPTASPSTRSSSAFPDCSAVPSLHSSSQGFKYGSRFVLESWSSLLLFKEEIFAMNLDPLPLRAILVQ